MDNTQQNNATERIYVFDTTLRDGDQASGFHFRPREKLEIAKQLADLGVDIIEAGFGKSGKDYEIVSSIASEIGTLEGPIICSLARANYQDVDAAAKAVENAKKKRIHTFIATSDIHMKDKLRKSKEQIIEMAVNAVKRARNYVDDVEFSCEDFGRSDLNYIVDIVEEAIKAGAETINLPDTVGFMYPTESYQRVKFVIDSIRERGLNAIFSVHNHNDLGMASANTIEGVRAGARQVEVTVNGIGERAGNTSLEEVVATMTLRNIGTTNINRKLIGPTSRLVAKYGSKPQPNKAIVGTNAFAHEAGIHQDGMIKSSGTYEILNPEDYGMESSLTLGPRSGKNGIGRAYLDLGIKMDEETLISTVERFKTITEDKKVADHADLMLAFRGQDKIAEFCRFVGYHPVSVNGTVKVLVDVDINCKRINAYGEGNGQIDAARNAITNATGIDFNIIDYQESSESSGSDAVGFTRIKFAKNGWEVYGEGEDTDIVKSAIRAIIDGCNRINYLEENRIKNS